MSNRTLHLDYLSGAGSGTDRGAAMDLIIRLHPSAKEDVAYREARRRYERKAAIREIIEDVAVVVTLATGIGYVFWCWLNFWI